MEIDVQVLSNIVTSEQKNIRTLLNQVKGDPSSLASCFPQLPLGEKGIVEDPLGGSQTSAI